LRELAEAYAQKEDFMRASRCFEELLKLRPTDRNIEDRLRNLRAAEHLQATKMEEKKSFREAIRDEDKAQELEESGRIVRTADDADAVIARCQAKLRENPKDVENLLKLGDMFQRKEQFNFAMASYNKAAEVAPQQYNVRIRIGDLKIRLLKREEDEASEAAKREPQKAEVQAKAKKALGERVDYSIQEFETRYKEHPTEVSLAHQLGMLYWEKGTPDAISKAISCFQKSMDDPRVKTQARFMLGQCFAKDPKTRDMAIEEYEAALKLVASPSTEMGKTIQYNLGQLHEQATRKSQALEWYKKVLSVDASFKDVRQKIEQLS
jgi:tetratricopeptide (TPR) repeat protein